MLRRKSSRQKYDNMDTHTLTIANQLPVNRAIVVEGRTFFIQFPCNDVYEYVPSLGAIFLYRDKKFKRKWAHKMTKLG